MIYRFAIIREVYATRIRIECPDFSPDAIHVTSRTVLHVDDLQEKLGFRNYTTLFTIGDIIIFSAVHKDDLWYVNQLRTLQHSLNPPKTLLTDGTVVYSERSHCELRTEPRGIIIRCPWFAVFPGLKRTTPVSSTLPAGTPVHITAVYTGKRYIAQSVLSLTAVETTTPQSNPIRVRLQAEHPTDLTGAGLLCIEKQDDVFIVTADGTRVFVPATLLPSSMLPLSLVDALEVEFDAQLVLGHADEFVWTATRLMIADQTLVQQAPTQPSTTKVMQSHCDEVLVSDKEVRVEDSLVEATTWDNWDREASAVIIPADLSVNPSSQESSEVSTR